MKGKTQDLRLAVRLTPKASGNAVRGWAEDAAGNRYLKVSVTAVPEKGKANKALIEVLAKEWDIPKNSIAIIRGATDKKKILILKAIPEKTASCILSFQSL